MKNCLICEKENLLEKHHIQSKCYNGTNDSSNISKICVSCHKLIHYGLIIIEGWFASTGGIILIWRKLKEESITGLEDPKVWLYKNHKIIQEQYLNKRKLIDQI